MNINHLLSSRTQSEISFILCELSQKHPSSVTKYCRNLLFYIRIPSETFYHLWHFPWETSYVKLSMRTSIFLSEFISECHSLCQIQLKLHFFLSEFTWESVCSPQNLLSIRFHLLFSVRFYIRSFYFLSDFNSEATRFCNILHQNLLLSVKFYHRSSKFLSDFYTRNCKFLSDFTSETPSLFQIFTIEPPSFPKILA